jgi:hypothetical protein
MGELRSRYQLLVGVSKGKRQFGRRGLKWEDNIKMYLREIAYGSVDCSALAQDKGPVAGSCERGNEPSGSIKRWGISWVAERLLAF